MKPSLGLLPQITLLDTRCLIVYASYMRKTLITKGEYYHIYNRGNRKQNTFLEQQDYIRFLFTILYFQSPLPIYNISSAITYFMKHRVFNSSKNEQVVHVRTVDLNVFTLMPNHFHLIVYEREENGISTYMQRVQNAYTKYFNNKYEMSGHLFQGPYQSVHIENNEQLLHVSAYIHRNQREISKWKNKERDYPWSSYQDYADQNRWGELLNQKIILKQFANQSEYVNFVETSGTKIDKTIKHSVFNS